MLIQTIMLLEPTLVIKRLDKEKVMALTMAFLLRVFIFVYLGNKV